MPVTGHQRIRLRQPGLFALSIMRAELSGKTLCVAAAGLIPSPSMGESQGDGGQVFAKDLDIVWDSLANPANIAAVLKHLSIVTEP
jgi:hypothetical protein